MEPLNEDNELCTLQCWSCSGTGRLGQSRPCFKCGESGRLFWQGGYSYPYTPHGERNAKAAAKELERRNRSVPEQFIPSKKH